MFGRKNLPIRACQSPVRGLLSDLFLGKAVRLTAPLAQAVQRLLRFILWQLKFA